jgi:hypothetical protein
MNQMTINLQDFFADRDIESLRVLCLEQHGIDFTAVYCQSTGRKIGTFDDFVIQFAIDEESTDDDESLIDALMVRCIASMRPSPMLNRPDRVTLLNLASKHPVDVMAYLVNRLHSNRWIATHKNIEILEPHIAKIHTHFRWSAMAANGVDLSPWIHWLLELDAKRNLHELTPPCVQLDRLNKWFVSNIGDSLLYLVTADNEKEMLAIFEAWTFQRLKEFDARDREVLKQAEFMRGNTMTQTAYARSWLENPQFASKRAEMASKNKNRVKVERPKSEKAQKLDAKVSQFLFLLDDIMDNESVTVTPKKPAPVQRTGANLPFLNRKRS